MQGHFRHHAGFDSIDGPIKGAVVGMQRHMQVCRSFCLIGVFARLCQLDMLGQVLLAVLRWRKKHTRKR